MAGVGDTEVAKMKLLSAMPVLSLAVLLVFVGCKKEEAKKEEAKKEEAKKEEAKKEEAKKEERLSKTGESCTKTEDCERPLRCVQQQCVDCYPACDDGLVCVEGKCIPDPEGTCGKAFDCCEKIADRSGNSDTALYCRNLKKTGVPEEACRTALKGFKQSAKALAVSCD